MVHIIPLIILLMCTPYGNTMKVKSIQMSDVPIQAELQSSIMERKPTCAEKIAALTQRQDQFLQLTETPIEPSSLECEVVAPPVPFAFNDVLYTLGCQIGNPNEKVLE